MPNPVHTLNRFVVFVVTGGSSGIGMSIVKAIRRVSPEVVVCNISRSKPDFFSGENDLHFPCDLTDRDAIAETAGKVCEIVSKCAEGEVALINNSGFGDYGHFHLSDANKQLKMIDLNISAMVDLTARLLPVLTERGGIVVNVSSTASFQPTPYMSTYGASKAFVTNWTLALNQDLKGTGVSALAICPGPTRTNFFKAAGFSERPAHTGLGMSAEEVGEQMLRAIEKRRVLLVNGWMNRIIVTLSSLAPRTLAAWVGEKVLRRVRLESGRRAVD